MSTNARVDWFESTEALPEPGATILLATESKELIECFFHFDFSTKTATALHDPALVYQWDEIFYWGKKPNGPRRESPVSIYNRKYRQTHKRVKK